MFRKTLLALAIGAAFGVSLPVAYAQNTSPVVTVDPVVNALPVVEDTHQGSRNLWQDRRTTSDDRTAVRQTQNTQPGVGGIRTDLREIGQDRREIAHDRLNPLHDNRGFGNDRREIAHDRRDIRHDNREIRNDRREIAHDLAEIRHDNRVIGEGKRGPITTRLQALFFDTVNGRNPSKKAWLTTV